MNPQTTTTVMKERQKAEKPVVEAAFTTEGIQTLNIVEVGPSVQEQKKTQVTDIVESTVAIPDINFKPTPDAPTLLATKYQVGTAQIRYPLTLKKLRKVSTFIPISLNYFEVLHYMDTLMCSNIYFQRLGLPWHPLLSRLPSMVSFAPRLGTTLNPKKLKTYETTNPWISYFLTYLQLHPLRILLFTQETISPTIQTPIPLTTPRIVSLSDTTLKQNNGTSLNARPYLAPVKIARSNQIPTLMKTFIYEEENSTFPSSKETTI